MIEPHLATMLGYILTDADVSESQLSEAFREGVEESFNCISVDGDESTSDTVLGISSCKGPAPEPGEFAEALKDVMRALSRDIVRNGEGTAHVISAQVKGALGCLWEGMEVSWRREGRGLLCVGPAAPSLLEHTHFPTPPPTD